MPFLFETVLQDLRHGARSLLRNRQLAAASVFALALGIGVNTAALTAFKTVLGRGIDAREPGRMVNLALTLQSGANAFLFSYPDYESYRDQVHAFSGLIAWSPDQLALSDAGDVVSERAAVAGSLFGKLGLLPAGASNAEFASTFFVSENYFRVLGATPLRGRDFGFMTRAELAQSPTVLISENYWQRRFAGNPAVLGRVVRLNGVRFTIAGITPHDFTGTSLFVPDFWLPLSLRPLVHPGSSVLQDRENMYLRLYGRLRAGIAIGQAQAEFSVVTTRVSKLHVANSEWSRPAAAVLSPGSPLPGKLPAPLKFAITLIMVAVWMVLVIACANAASLQLARATARQNELNIRLSLGASRGRLLRQLLTESALLGLVAGAVAFPFTLLIVKAGATAFEQAFPIQIGAMVLNVTPDLEVFGYVSAISIFAGLLFGLAPALESSRGAPFAAMRGNTGSASVRSRRLRSFLMASQAAISLVLLISGSMLIRSSLRALGMATGYDAKHVIDLDFRFPESAKYNAERKLAIVRELRARIAALPGVAAVTTARAPDDNNARAAAVSIHGEKPSPRNMQAVLYYTWVQPNYFETLGVPLLLGSGFEDRAGGAEHSAILSESAARRLWPGRNPIGRSLRLGTDEQFHATGDLLPDGPSWVVIGVASDTRGVLSDGSDSAQVYLPLSPDRLSNYPILIRTHADPKSITLGLDSVVSSIDPEVVISVSTLDEMLRQTGPFLGAVFSAAIATTIGLFGLLLAAMGIYGTVSYVAALRTREVGIRMAVGAQKGDIVWLMMRQSTQPVIAGLIAGMGLAIAAAYALRGVLYGVNSLDGVSFVGTSLFFLMIGMIAAWPPARRATRVDPMTALRYE